MDESQPYRYLFGPVPSRRLGRSLGVDLVPFKYCTFDCVYCQLGATTHKTITREEFVPLDDVVAELERKLRTDHSPPDYITMSGSGEPTLYSRLGELIAAIKGFTDVPVAVITNGSLLWDPDVRASLLDADLVVPSMDAGDRAMLQRVNRPDPRLDFDAIVEGLIAFRGEFANQLWLEVVVLAYTSVADVEKIAAIARRARPDRIQLNTVVRPPTESSALPVSPDRMAQFAALFDEGAEVVADFTRAHEEAGATATRDDVLAMLERRPCSTEDIAVGLGIHRNEVVKHVGHLLDEGAIAAESRGDVTFYVAKTG